MLINRLLWPLSVLLALLVMLVNIQLTGESSISSIDYLRYDLAGLTNAEPGDGWIDRWLWTDESPYKYRLLGRLPLAPATDLLAHFVHDREQAFYRAFIGWSFLLLCGFLVLFARYAQRILRAGCAGLGERQVGIMTVLALLLVSLSPPVLFMFKYPVHGTPNDILGYLLMTAGMFSLLERRVLACALVVTVAVFCRETTLLVVFVLLLFTRLPLQQRLLASGVPLVTLFLYRVLWPGGYDPWPGAQLNLGMPLESLGFLLICFGPLWLLGTLGWLRLRKLDSDWLRPLVQSFPWSVLLVLGVVLAMARIREIRIPYILFLYFVPFATVCLYAERERLKRWLTHRLFPLYLVAVAVLLLKMWSVILPDNPHRHEQLVAWLGVIYTGYPLTPQYNWIGILLVSLTLLIACLPLAIPYARRPA